MSDFVMLIDSDNNGVLGKGAYGEVKLVQEITTGMKYALQILVKEELLKFESKQNVKQEVIIQKRLNHPNIANMINFFEDKTNVYLQLEYAECGTLFYHLKTKKCFSEKEAFVFFSQTCLGINYLHKNKIIHRDLKSENLLFDNKGNIKLFDFGWNAEYVANAKRSINCGTLDYIAPEMLNNQNYDYSIDIWSLGILLYELLHGYPPFQGISNHEMRQNILTMKQNPFKIGISPECQDLIKRILQFESRSRLSMQGIFEHAWVLKMGVQQHQIQMYLNDAGQKQNILEQESVNSVINSHLQQKANTNAYNQLTFDNQQNTNDFDKYKNQKASVNLSKQNKGIDKEEVEIEEEGFWRKILVALGCATKRYK